MKPSRMNLRSSHLTALGVALWLAPLTAGLRPNLGNRG